MRTDFVKQPDHEKAQVREKMLTMILRKGFKPEQFWANALPETFGKNRQRRRGLR